METLIKHPRCLEPEAVKKGLRVELIENDEIIDTGTVTSSERKLGWGVDRQTISFNSEKGLGMSEFVHFAEHRCWKIVFQGMLNERCVATSDRSHKFDFRGCTLQPM